MLRIARLPPRSALLRLSLITSVLCALWTGFSPSVTHAFDTQVPMPPSAGWPAFPRPVKRVEIPSTCGTSLHNLFCSQSSSLEKSLEQEFWLLIGNLDSPTSPSVAGLEDWVNRTAVYVGYIGRYTGVAAPQNWYGGFRGGPEKNRGRLTMLLAAAHTALFRVYDIDTLALAALRGDIIGLIGNASQIPALYHVIESVKYADEAAHLIPAHQNSLAFLYGLGAFLQWALPVKGIDIAKILPNVRGGLGLRHALPLGFEGGKASIESAMTSAAPCDSPATCSEKAGTEGVVAGASAMALLGIDAMATSRWPGLEHYSSLVEAAIDMLYDPIHGDCGTYACAFTSSIAPFKKIGELMMISTSWGRLGNLTEMRAGFDQLRELAAQQRWPFIARFNDMEARIEGTGPYAGNSLLDQWKINPEKKRLGYIQLPLPPFTGVTACSDCHFGAEMPNPRVYE